MNNDTFLQTTIVATGRWLFSLLAIFSLGLSNTQAQTDEQWIYLFLPADNPTQQGFARLTNISNQAGQVEIIGIDDAGVTSSGTVTVDLTAGATVHFNSQDVENGNPGKGMTGGLGDGTGNWRLRFSSDLELDIMGLFRNTDGFVNNLHDTADSIMNRTHSIGFFNPGSNSNQASRLRLINISENTNNFSITGIDDAGSDGGGTATVILGPNQSTEVSAAQLEQGTGPVSGSIGDGTGKWRLTVQSTQPAKVMSLLEDPNDYLSNLSSTTLPDDNGVFTINYMLPEDSSAQGFVRIINPNDSATTVTVAGIDDAGQPSPGNITIDLNPQQTINFNSGDYENGNTSKGLQGALGNGTGNWRLVITATQNIEVMGLFRTPLGFVNNIHGNAENDLATSHIVSFFNPGSNTNQASRVRLNNPNSSQNTFTITGTDDAGAQPGSAVSRTLAANESVEITATELEAQGLGDGVGKWRLDVTSTLPSSVQSLLIAPGDFRSNLSTVRPNRDIAGEAEQIGARAFAIQPVNGSIGANNELTLQLTNNSDLDFYLIEAAIQDTNGVGVPTTLQITDADDGLLRSGRSNSIRINTAGASWPLPAIVSVMVQSTDSSTRQTLSYSFTNVALSDTRFSAPQSIIGTTFALTITGGSGDFDTSGNNRLEIVDGSNYAIVDNADNTVLTQGTYTYRAEGNRGILALTDVPPAGEDSFGLLNFTLEYSSTGDGTYSIETASIGSQQGSFTDPNMNAIASTGGTSTSNSADIGRGTLAANNSGSGSGGSSGGNGGSGNGGSTGLTVTASVSAGGSVNMDSVSLNSGETASFTFTSNSGFALASVSGCSGTLSGMTYTTGAVTEACAVNAVFSDFSPTPSLRFDSQKRFTFEWSTNGQVDHYQLLENADGQSGFSNLGDQIFTGVAATSWTHSIFVPLYRRQNARYILETCFASGECNSSSTVAVSGNLVNAVGYFKAIAEIADHTFDYFGESVALSKDGLLFAVGAPHENNRTGAVYVYLRVATSTWQLARRITAEDGQTGDEFGMSVSLDEDGNVLAVGAPFVDGTDSSGNAEGTQGSVYIFSRSGANWSQEQKIILSDVGGQGRARMGWSVSLNSAGTRLAIGAPHATNGQVARVGDAYVLSGSVFGGFSLVQRIERPAGETDDWFGEVVDLSDTGNSLAVSSLGDDSGFSGPTRAIINDNDAMDSGAAFIFDRRSSSNYQFRSFIKANNTGSGDRFGGSLSLSGEGLTLAVGANNEDSAANASSDNNDSNNSGAVYTFRTFMGDFDWHFTGQVKNSQFAPSQLFGTSVDLDRDGLLLVVGVEREHSFLRGVQPPANAGGEGAIASGGALIYEMSNGDWQERVLLKAGNPDNGDVFGRAVSMSSDGNTVAVGAPFEDSNATGPDGDQTDNSASDSGAVYVF